MRFQMLMAEAARSVRASLSTTFAATMTVLIGMFLLGLTIALGTWVLSWSNSVEEGLKVKVFFCTENTCDAEAKEAEIGAVQRWLDSNDRVRSHEFISKERALEIMEEKTPDLVRDLSYNPLPHAIEVTPVNGDQVEAIAASIRQRSFVGVQEVGFGEDTARRVIKVGQVISIIFLGVVILLLAASALLIANTIRLSIYARRREIEVMKLVGASNWFVRGPFMLEGVFCGLAGALIAVFLLLLGKEIALPAILPRFEAGSEVEALAFPLTALILLGVGLLLGAAGSGLTLRRFLQV